MQTKKLKYVVNEKISKIDIWLFELVKWKFKELYISLKNGIQFSLRMKLCSFQQ